MHSLKVASVQFEHVPGNKAANFEKIESFIKQAAEKNVQMIIFPECCITGYFFLRHLSEENLRALAEPYPEGASSKKLLALSVSYDMTIGAGFVEAGEDRRLYNSYVVAMPDGKMVRHRKIHAFVSKYLSCGSEYTVFDTPYGIRAGILICYDNNIVENVRINALMGADVIIAPHQTGGCRTADPNIMGIVDKSLWGNRMIDACTIESEFKGEKGRGWLMRWLPSRAHDNGVFYIFSNGVGVDDDEIRTGNSMIIDPYGRILAETWKAADDMVIASLDMSLRNDNTGQRWITARRPDLYAPLAVSTGKEVDMQTARFSGKGA